MMYYAGGGYNMIGYSFGWLVMLSVFILVVLGIMVLVSYLKQSNKRDCHSALSILNERYAKGEIDDEEYKKMKSNIKKAIGD